MSTARADCPHCGRSTAVIGKAGQLARHACKISPTMTPEQRIRVARDNESRLRRNRQFAIHLQARDRVRMNVCHTAALALLPVAIFCFLYAMHHTSIGFGDDGDAITSAYIPLLPWFFTIGSTLAGWRLRVAGDGYREHRWHTVLPRLGELAIAYEEAWAELTAAEAELPAHIVWPELHALPLTS
jgi:hypothetical protein